MFRIFSALAVLGISGAVVFVRTQEPTQPQGPGLRQLGGNPSYGSPFGWPPPAGKYVFALNRFDKGQFYGAATFFDFATADGTAKANVAADPSTRWQVYAYPALAGSAYP